MSETKLLAIARRTGRLANRLVLFANFVAFAEEYGYHVTNVSFHSYARWFESLRSNLFCRYPPPSGRGWLDCLPGMGSLLQRSRVLYHLTRWGSAAIDRLPICGQRVVTLKEMPSRDVTDLDDESIHRFIQPARLVFVNGWTFRAPSLLRKHADKVRNFLRPLPSVSAQATEIAQRLRSRADVLVGVHIRGGDFRTWQGGRYFFEIPRYAAWMAELAEQFPGQRVGFLVSSDESLSPEAFARLTVEIAPGPAVHDLFTLANCDYILGPVSTFSQWASFYGQTPLYHVRHTDERIAVERFRVSFFEEIP